LGEVEAGELGEEAEFGEETGVEVVEGVDAAADANADVVVGVDVVAGVATAGSLSPLFVVPGEALDSRFVPRPTSIYRESSRRNVMEAKEKGKGQGKRY
jgi:hypothetical protein